MDLADGLDGETLISASEVSESGSRDKQQSNQIVRHVPSWVWASEGNGS
jgi:hypothetical protein